MTSSKHTTKYQIERYVIPNSRKLQARFKDTIISTFIFNITTIYNCKIMIKQTNNTLHFDIRYLNHKIKFS